MLVPEDDLQGHFHRRIHSRHQCVSTIHLHLLGGSVIYAAGELANLHFCSE